MNPHITQLGRDYPDIEVCLPDVEKALGLIGSAFYAKNRLLVCGNGGSAADADHIVGELLKGFLLKRPLSESQQQRLKIAYPDHGSYLATNLQEGLPAVNLCAHTALATAFSNDVAPDLVFAQQVHVYGRPGDILIGISTSGRSANVLHALRVARMNGIHTVGLTGKSGGEMAAVTDVLIKVPYDQTPRIQERHLPIYHALCVALEDGFFGTNAKAS